MNALTTLRQLTDSLHDRLTPPKPERVHNVPEDDIRYDTIHIDNFPKHEFEVIEIKPDKEFMWLRPTSSQKHFRSIVSHIDATSELGETLSQVSEGQFITVEMKRYTKGEEYMPFWCIEAIHNVRAANGTELNILQ